jgi:hypothetical protein
MALALQQQPGMGDRVYLREEPMGGHGASTAVGVATFIARRFNIEALR